MIIPYFASDDADTLDIINRGSEEELERKDISFSDPYLRNAEADMCSTHQRMDRIWLGASREQVIQIFQYLTKIVLTTPNQFQCGRCRY